MALSNFSLQFGAAALQPWGITTNPLQPNHISSKAASLLYNPAAHQQPEDEIPPPPDSDYYRNNPYGPPQTVQPNRQYSNGQYSSNTRSKIPNTYLPPIPTASIRNPLRTVDSSAYQQTHHSHLNSQISNNVGYKSTSSGISPSTSSASNQAFSRSHEENTYSPFPPPVPRLQSRMQPQNFFTGYSPQARAPSSQQELRDVSQQVPDQSVDNANVGGKTLNTSSDFVGDISEKTQSDSGVDPFPIRPPGFTRVQAGQGSRTQVHAVLDYDIEDGEEEEYYDDEEEIGKDGRKKSQMPTVTPIQGPILLKNGTVPVVPLFSYPTVNNGSFVQIPIWWTALSVALGLDVRGDVIKGVPCVKRYHQLFCPTAGNTYPIDKIERFIDDNKALMRRMYGDFEMNMDTGGGGGGGPQQKKKMRKRRFIDEPDLFIPPGAFPAVIPPDDVEGPHSTENGESYFGNLRNKRQSSGQNRNSKPPNFNPNNSGGVGSSTGRLDACESKVEIVTPYWASNSAGKIRAIVNTQHFEQAIHQEICSKSKTPRCQKDCGCEQKYKWHRLLAYDPDNDCKGIFMDWFLFPSCCVCRCFP